MSEVSNIYNGYIKPMRFTIDTRNTESGSSNSDQYKLPLISTGTYDFVVEWGDGNSDTITQYDQTEVTHTYETEGEYEITLTGKIVRVAWGGLNFTTNDRLKLVEVKDWGNAIMYLTDSPFWGCENWFMSTDKSPTFGDKTAGISYRWENNNSISGDFSLWGTIDEPITVQTLQGCFQIGDQNPNLNFVANVGGSSYAAFRSDTLNSDFDNWNVSGLSGLRSTFSNCYVFNGDIENWNVSGVTRMSSTFANCYDFNRDISNWDVSNVTDMTSTFQDTRTFNQPIGKWDVGKVTNMNSMFRSSNFNQPIGEWNTSSVTSFFRTFIGAGEFNQPIGNWDVSSAENMSEMFYNSDKFNQDIGNWNVSGVTNMSRTFAGTPFNNGGSPSINGWDVSNVTNMYSMFFNSPFNQPIGDWNVANVTNFRDMFRNAIKFNQPIGNWDVSNVTNMSNMFRLSQFKQDISSWDVSNVSNMFGMFYDSQFNIDIGSWNVSNVTNFSDMFRNRRTFTRPHFNNGDSPSISGWTLTTDPTKSINMTRMFYENLDFNQPIGSWDMSRVTNISQMFYNRFSFSNGGAAFDQDLSNWDVSNVVDMYEFSFGLKSMSKENIASLNNWNVTSKCTRIGNVFNGPPDLTLLDLSGWDVSGCNDFWYAFSAQYGGQNLPFSPKVSGWTFSTATTVNIRATGMFYNRTTFNEDITGWNTERFNSTSSMFSNCSSFNQNLGVWNISNNGNMSGMFNNSGMSTENYSNTLIGWAAQAPNIQSNVPLGAVGISYNASAQDAVDLLTGTYGWTITDNTP